ncbi:MAG: SH3 domain-containing protein [Alphaproteobacteria bacterium]
MRLAALPAVLMSLLLATLLLPDQATAAPGDLLETSRRNVNVRIEPSTGAGIVATVNPGDRMIEVQRSNDWYLIDLPDLGSRGWVYGPLIDNFSETPEEVRKPPQRRTGAYTTAATYDPGLIGDPRRGEAVFVKCGSCHTTVAGIHAEGPSLVGVFGRAPAEAPNYRYSGAMQAFARNGTVWDKATLDRFIQRPGRIVKGTSMPFSGLRDAQDRSDVIAFLQQLSR